MNRMLSARANRCRFRVRGLAVTLLVGAFAFAGALAQEAAPDPRPQYAIGPGDVLEVFIYDEQQRESCLVRPDGRISLPLAGEIVAAGKTPEDVANAVSDALQKFMTKRPTVTVKVVTINSYRVYVLGKVGSQGAITSVVPLRLLQVIAMSGGANEFATGKVVVLREGPNGGQIRREIDYDRVLSGKNPEQNVWLQADDIVVVE
ncbi:MAG: sugar ABC transporter substrate-binding protein [Acidobacteria bacterium]|nr:sugar ABC transporter substrate-binding protein [Acidobacteriota bacterium]